MEHREDVTDIQKRYSGNFLEKSLEDFRKQPEGKFLEDFQKKTLLGNISELIMIS